MIKLIIFVLLLLLSGNAWQVEVGRGLIHLSP